jgi:hypothetical protein
MQKSPQRIVKEQVVINSHRMHQKRNRYLSTTKPLQNCRNQNISRTEALPHAFSFHDSKGLSVQLQSAQSFKNIRKTIKYLMIVKVSAHFFLVGWS